MIGCRSNNKKMKLTIIMFFSICASVYMLSRTNGIQWIRRKNKISEYVTFSNVCRDLEQDGHKTIEESKPDKRNKLELNIRQNYMHYLEKDIISKTYTERLVSIPEGQLLLQLGEKHLNVSKRNMFHNVYFYGMAIDLPQVVKNHKLGISIYKPVNIYEYGLLHNLNEPCKENEHLVFFIKSKISNFKQRIAIRRTWASDNLMKHLKMRRIFFIGSSKNETDARNVYSEVRKYNDVVQFDFYDDYYNNTLKTTGAIYWANNFCNNSKFFFFIDDDFFVSTERLMKYVHSTVFKMKGHVYLGNVLSDVPNRVKGSKWYVSKDVYPYSVYPPFVRGGAMILSRSLIEDLCAGILYTKRFIFDDVFIAIVAFKLQVTPSHQPLFSIDHVSYNEKLFKSIYVSHGYKKVTEMYKAWNCTIISPSSPVYPNFCRENAQTNLTRPSKI